MKLFEFVKQQTTANRQVKKKIINYFLKIVFFLSIFLICSSCNIQTPPLELAPNRDIIEKALYMQLEIKTYSLSTNLHAKPLDYKITTINVEQITPLIIANLPVYHLTGKYNLNLHLINKKLTQTNKHFDLYLQRQKEGKTWRLISQNLLGNNP